jgi:hypothetical protein
MAAQHVRDCPVCRGMGVCPDCKGLSAVIRDARGNIFVKYEVRSKMVGEVNTALSAEEYKKANNPYERANCEECISTGRCPRCGHTGNYRSEASEGIV